MPKYKINIIDLPYNYDVLKPYISQETMKHHYEELHKKYLTSLKLVMDKHPKVFSYYNFETKG